MRGSADAQRPEMTFKIVQRDADRGAGNPRPAISPKSGTGVRSSKLGPGHSLGSPQKQTFEPKRPRISLLALTER